MVFEFLGIADCFTLIIIHIPIINIRILYTPAFSPVNPNQLLPRSQISSLLLNQISTFSSYLTWPGVFLTFNSILIFFELPLGEVFLSSHIPGFLPFHPTASSQANCFMVVKKDFIEKIKPEQSH